MTLGPRMRISPSEAIFTSQPGRGTPTVPIFTCPGRLTVAAADVSVSP